MHRTAAPSSALRRFFALKDSSPSRPKPFYGLGALALDPQAVRKIFAAKDRPDWDPLIVHVRDLAMAQ